MLNYEINETINKDGGDKFHSFAGIDVLKNEVKMYTHFKLLYTRDKSLPLEGKVGCEATRMR